MSKEIAYVSFSDAQKKFKAKGSDLIAIVMKDGTRITSRAPTTKEKVAWTCAKCKKETTCKVEGLRAKTQDKYFCRGCAISLSKGGGSVYDKFVTELTLENWQMVSKSSEYKNTKSKMDVTCPYGHPSNFTYNVWQQGKRVCVECYNEGLHSHKIIEDVIKEFAEKGITLLEKKWENTHKPMSCVCSCGRPRMLTYNNMKKSEHAGCKDCVRRNKYADVEDFFEENGCILVSTGDGEKSEFIVNETHVNYICFCGAPYRTIWKLFKRGARCRACTRETIKRTCMTIYGVPNPAMSEDVKKKIVDSMVERFGVEHHMKLQKYVDQAKETNIANHGGVHNLCLPEIRIAAEEGYFKKYKNFLGHVEEIMEKTRTTNRRNLGVDYPFQSSEIQTRVKESRKEKWGVENPMQVPEFLQKARQTAFSSKRFIFPSGREEFIQGYEPYALLDILDGCIGDVSEDDIVVDITLIPLISYVYEEKDRKYYPDIYIPSRNLIIEIKSTYTLNREYDKNIKKFHATLDAGYNMELWVYDDDGNRIDTRVYCTCELVYE